MPRFTTAIDIDGQRVEINIPRGTKAWRLANSVFCPLGPSPTQAWFVLTRQSVNALNKDGQHTITWQHIETDDDPDSPTQTTRTLEFSGLYIVKAERLLPGAPGDSNALYLVEFADGRYLAAKKSDSGSLRINLRTFANAADYLPETDDQTWASMVESLWTACGTLGGFFGMPAGLPLDGVPQNHWFAGLNAYRALNAVLEQLDCAIRHDPLANLYSIVQLGSDQEIADANESLKYNGEPITPAASKAAANLNIHFYWHRKSYGQERDTELENNWAYNGDGTFINEPTGITGAQGTLPLWDDLLHVFDENNSSTNSAELNTRVQNRKSRYVTRWSVQNKHRIHWGLRTEFKPQGQIRAVLWRNWCDPENPLGGTVTEFICQPELVTGLRESDGGPAWFDSQLAAPEREVYSPPDYNRGTFPNYPRLPNIVQVWDTGSAEGDTIEPNDEGFHRGRVKRWVAGEMATLDDCWILFVDDYDNVQGQVEARKGEYYGPARLSGVRTIDGALRPVYLVRKGAAQSDVVVFELTDSIGLGGTAPARVCTLNSSGAYLANGESITVVDAFFANGCWQGLAGYRGIACRRTDGAYDILFMERPALIVEFELYASLTGAPATTGSAIANVLFFYQQGGKKVDAAIPYQTTVFDPLDLFRGMRLGQKGIAIWNDVRARYEIVSGPRSAQDSNLIVFELNDELEPGDQGTAAEICSIDPGFGTWGRNGTAIVVRDRLNGAGQNSKQWRAPSGARGFAIKTDAAQQSGRDVYEIVFMERRQMFVPFIVESIPAANEWVCMYADGETAFQLGDITPKPEGGGDFKVFDRYAMFPRALVGSHGLAVYNDQADQYVPVSCTQRAILLRATADEAFAGGTTSIVTVNNVVMSPPPFDILPAAEGESLTVSNRFAHAGPIGIGVMLCWDNTFEQYVIIDVQKRTLVIQCDTRDNGTAIQGLMVEASIEYTTAPVWVSKITPTAC